MTGVTLPETLTHHLRARRRLSITTAGATPCAVLIPLVLATIVSADSASDDYEIVYTLRSEHLPSHKGQVAFPGGKRSGQEQSLETALRETAEEIGIDPADVQVIGCIDDVSTMAGQFVITPWIGLLPPGYAFRANPREVADIFAVPLSALADPRHHAQATRHWGGNSYELPVITAGRHEIWGATLQITYNLLAILSELRARR
ncbi:MAG TPA: CoA pyrophosphatase [Candidatus Binatia bacterium]|jgi:8-oxo-dGTP pyrophosphatase MutT (NUDIX family)